MTDKVTAIKRVAILRAGAEEMERIANDPKLPKAIRNKADDTREQSLALANLIELRVLK